MADQDKALFGPMNETVANEFQKLVEAALMEGVASLPLMGETTHLDKVEESRDHKMFEKLKKAYLRNVDALEIYSGRNVFSICNRTPHFRQRVVQAFLVAAKNGDSGASALSNEPRDKKEAAIDTETGCTFPTKDEIPSSKMMTAIENELKELRRRLHDARGERNKRQEHCTNMEEAAAFSEEATEALSSVSIQRLPKATETLKQAEKEFGLLQNDGNALMEIMEDRKKTREAKGHEPDKLPTPKKPKMKRKTLTLEEHYQEHKKILVDSNSQAIDVKAVRGMFQQEL